MKLQILVEINVDATSIEAELFMGVGRLGAEPDIFAVGVGAARQEAAMGEFHGKAEIIGEQAGGVDQLPFDLDAERIEV